MRNALFALFVLVGCGDNIPVAAYDVEVSGVVNCTGQMSLVFDGQDISGAWSCGSMRGDVVGRVVTPFTGHVEMDAQTGDGAVHVIVTKNDTELNGVAQFPGEQTVFRGRLR